MAREELSEETGASCTDLRYVGWMYGAPGTSDSIQHIFLATGVRLDTPPHREETEQMEVHCIPIAKAVRMAQMGEIKDSHSVVALLLCTPYLLERVKDQP